MLEGVWGSASCGAPMSVILLALAQLDEETVGLAGMDPCDLRPPVVDAHAFVLEVLDAAGDVLGVEADQVDTFALLREELPDRLARVRRLHQLDVAGAERQDRVL